MDVSNALALVHFYLLTTHNGVKQLYFCIIGSFVNSNKLVGPFNGETFVKQSVVCEVSSFSETPVFKVLLPER